MPAGPPPRVARSNKYILTAEAPDTGKAQTPASISFSGT